MRIQRILVIAATLVMTSAAGLKASETCGGVAPRIAAGNIGCPSAGDGLTVERDGLAIGHDGSDNVPAADEAYIYNKVDSLQPDTTVKATEALADIGLKADTIAPKKQKRDWATWAPDPKRAMWLAVVLPGAGQIYNRKYWKLPIVYGGFLGCAYAWRWNNQMYRDYSQAYMDIMDDDPSTQSYNEFLHLGATINESNLARYQNLFKKRKDYYRRYRDLSIFCLIGVYALSIIDAYVDASLSQFDISKDLSLRIEPSVINNHTSANPVRSSALGLQCSLNF